MQKQPSRRKVLTLALSASSLAALSACAGIPTGGSVNRYGTSQGDEATRNSDNVPDGPNENASPEDIIRGFFRAGVSSNDDYDIARQFLTSDVAQSWRADARALVYARAVTIVADENQEGKYLVSVPTATEVNELGLTTSYKQDENREFEVELTRVNEQWRISSLPDGLVLRQEEFQQSFAPFTLYFYDRTFTYAVPDVRWFADRSSIATSLVRVLLLGPAPYLEGAVRSAIPDGTTLTRSSVPISDAVAEVSLSGTGISEDMSQLDVERINTQLKQTLSPLSGIQSIRLLFGDQNITTGSLSGYIEAQVNPSVSKSVVGIETTELTLRNEVLNEDSVVTVYAPESEGMSKPAMGYTRQVFAFLSPNVQALSLVRNDQRSVVLEGEGITTPSFDQFQWMWAAEANATVHLVGVTGSRGDVEKSTVEAKWLTGATVLALRISRDGARAAIVAQSEGESFLWVSGVRRNSDNKPEALSEPVRIGTNFSIDDARWVSDQSLIVANYETGQVEIAFLSGELDEVGQLDSLSQISACIGGDQVIAQTTNQSIYVLVERAWSRIETTAHDFNFSC